MQAENFWGPGSARTATSLSTRSTRRTPYVEVDVAASWRGKRTHHQPQLRGALRREEGDGWKRGGRNAKETGKDEDGEIYSKTSSRET